MPEKKDYYEVLGVPKEASEKDIKSAYRKLAMKYHPDRSDAADAEERFKEISEAYAVLSDPEKRQKYDQFGHAGISGQYSQEDIFRGVNFEDLLRGFGFGGSESIFDMFFGGSRGRGPGDQLSALRIQPRQAAGTAVGGGADHHGGADLLFHPAAGGGPGRGPGVLSVRAERSGIA